MVGYFKRYRRVLSATFAMIACAGLWGCQPEKTEKPDFGPLPTIGEIRPAPASTRNWQNGSGEEPGLPGLPDPKMTDTAGDTPGVPRAMQQLLVQRLLFKRDDARVNFALKLLDVPPISDEALALWRSNGMLWACCERDKLPMLMSNLPRPIDSFQYQATAGHAPLPIGLSGRLINSQRVRYFERPGESKLVKLTGGRYQMLMQLTEAKERDEPMRVELTPHHYNPRATLLPRSPNQKSRDGTTFDALQLNVAAPTETVWILWWAGPEADEKAESDPLDTESSANGAGRTARTARSARAADTGRPLGDALLTGTKSRQPIQLVLLLTVR